MKDKYYNNEPEYLRLPKSGEKCPVTGLSRTTLTELVVASPRNDNRPPVKSVLLKRRGALRGIRLVDRKSLLSYLNNLNS